MKPADIRWRRLMQAIAREAAQIGGFGRVTFEVVFADSVPHKVYVRERNPGYDLDHDPPPLLTAAGTRNILSDESE